MKGLRGVRTATVYLYNNPAEGKDGDGKARRWNGKLAGAFSLTVFVNADGSGNARVDRKGGDGYEDVACSWACNDAGEGEIVLLGRKVRCAVGVPYERETEQGKRLVVAVMLLDPPPTEAELAAAAKPRKAAKKPAFAGYHTPPALPGDAGDKAEEREPAPVAANDDDIQF